MKDGLKHIVGKVITAVVVARNKRQPHDQVFLVFSDGTRFELYGDFSCCAGPDEATGIESYVESAKGEVVTTESLMKRDLEAWKLAKAAIASAARRGQAG